MSARDEAVEMIRRICPPHLSADEYGRILAEKFDAHRAEVVAERDAMTVTWLVKKAREFRAEGRKERTLQAAALDVVASKIERGAVRPNNLRMLPPDFFEPGHIYTEDAPFRAPEDRPNFQCIAVAIHPTTGTRRALGFEQPGAGRPWKSSSLRDEEWADGWVDVTEGEAADA